MKTKEAIDFVERYRYARNSKTDEVIILLKRGAIFEAIYNKVKDIICSHNLIWLEKQMLGLEKTYSLKIENNNYDKICEELAKFHEKLLKKYFPKEK